MDWSQWLMAGLLVAAATLGRRVDPICIAVLAINLIATILLSHDPLAVGAFDAACIAALLFEPTRQRAVVALCFVAMFPVYIIGEIVSAPHFAIYACVDILALLQLWVAGNGDHGLVFGRLLGRNRRNRHGDCVQGLRGDVAGRSGRDTEVG